MINCRNILVVDDVAISRLIPGMILRPFGYQVYEVCNGQEAIDIMNIENFKFILLDLSMPVLTGYEILDYKSQGRFASEIKFIAYTHIDSDQHAQSLLTLGFDRVLKKPAKAVELINLANEICEH